jgi:hypothetical protein
MVDCETKQSLQVHTEGDAGPYLMVPLQQLQDVQQVLDDGGVLYSVAEDAIRLNGKPVIAVIDFRRGVDPDAIQALLDHVD